MTTRRLAIGGVSALCGAVPGLGRPARVHRIGVLGVHADQFSPSDENEQAFLDELARLGWVAGRNLQLISRASGHELQRLDALAAELVALEVDLILSNGGTPTALAAKRATATIPIVMVASRDPVADGLVASLFRPGANVTGNADMGRELVLKRVELLLQAVPAAKRLGYIVHERTLAQSEAQTTVAVMDAALRAQGRQLFTAVARQVAQGDDLDHVLDQLARQRVQAVVIDNYATIGAGQRRVAAALRRGRLPAIMEDASYARAGVMMTYTEPLIDCYRRAADYVHRILSGARPADLPVSRGTRFVLAINIDTARTLGLTIPATLKVQADLLLP